LRVDLTNRSSREEALDEAVLGRYLGGKGLATHLLLQNNPAGVDPFAPQNHIVLALGPASDTPLYGSCRHGIFSKSPLTGLYAESYSGGSLAIPMSRSGYDAVVIGGAADRPLWLEISDAAVRFHDAADLWGRDTFETEAEIRKRAAAWGPSSGPRTSRPSPFTAAAAGLWRNPRRSSSTPGTCWRASRTMRPPRPTAISAPP
jgi:aldehyde:ferredoxin oxidoreductase